VLLCLSGNKFSLVDGHKRSLELRKDHYIAIFFDTSTGSLGGIVATLGLSAYHWAALPTVASVFT
jgi:hypothetical protein